MVAATNETQAQNSVEKPRKKHKNRVKETARKLTTPREFNIKMTPIGVACVVVIMAIAVYFGLFQAQPWLHVGMVMSEGIWYVPLQGFFSLIWAWLSSLWLIGPFFEALGVLTSTIPRIELLGMVAFGVFTFFQVLPWYVSEKKSWKAVPNWVWAMLAATYLVEINLMVWHFQIYGDGFSDFTRDMWEWDPYLVNGKQFIQGLACSVMSEALSVLAIKMKTLKL